MQAYKETRTEATLTRSTIPSTRMSTSASTFLFHSSSIASRYCAEFCAAIDCWTPSGPVRCRFADGRADGRDTSVSGTPDIINGYRQVEFSGPGFAALSFLPLFDLDRQNSWWSCTLNLSVNVEC